MPSAVRHRRLLSKEAPSDVSRTRCSALRAGPQSRDYHEHPHEDRTLVERPRINSAPRHKNGAPGTLSRLSAPDRRHPHLLAPAGAAIDFLAGTELQFLAHADPHLAEPRLIAGHRNRRTAEAGIDLDKGVLDLGRRHGLRSG